MVVENRKHCMTDKHGLWNQTAWTYSNNFVLKKFFLTYKPKKILLKISLLLGLLLLLLIY